MEDGRRDHHDRKQQRDDDGRYESTRPGEIAARDAPALCGGSARGPQSPMDAVGKLVMADPALMFQQ